MRSFLVLCSLFLRITIAVDWNVTTPLDEYVWRNDGLYTYNVNQSYDFSEIDGLRCKIYVVNFTSGAWMDNTFSSQPVWWHWLIVSLPASAARFTFPDSAFMYISDGRNNQGVVPSPEGWKGGEINATCKYASDVGTAAGVLLLVPNQPIRFNDDSTGRSRSEDTLMAWTWRRFINDSLDGNPNPDVILQLPMTKGAVKGVDTIQNIVNEVYPELEAITGRVLVGGGSKRGWISWLLGCVDQRVAAMAPMVLSLLNMVEYFGHHYKSLGGWSWVLRDYHEEEILAFVFDEVAEELEKIIDPYAYRERLTMPKVVISGTGDEFFLPDDSHLFFEGLPEPKYMMMCENNDHPLPFAHERVFLALRTFFYALLQEDYELPQLEWERSIFEDEDENQFGRIELIANQEPKELMGWTAITRHPERRDFRLVIWGNNTPVPQPVIWRSEPVEQVGDNAFVYEAPYPAGVNDTRFRGFFINAVFVGPDPSEGHEDEEWDFDFTTEVHIVREDYPFERCDGWECMEGDLV